MKKGDVVTLVLINGAEIVGEWVDENGDVYTLNRPRMVQANQQGLGLVDGICMTGDKPDGNQSFNKHGVIFVIKTIDQISKGYKQQVSGLVLPSEGLKV